MPIGLSLHECMLMAAVFSAADEVATLSLIKQVSVLLFSLCGKSCYITVVVCSCFLLFSATIFVFVVFVRVPLRSLLSLFLVLFCFVPGISSRCSVVLGQIWPAQYRAKALQVVSRAPLQIWA